MTWLKVQATATPIEAPKMNDGESRRPRNFTYRFKPETADYEFTLTFKRSEVERGELIEALQEVLRRLVDEESPGEAPAERRDAGRDGRSSRRRPPVSPRP